MKSKPSLNFIFISKLLIACCFVFSACENEYNSEKCDNKYEKGYKCKNNNIDSAKYVGYANDRSYPFDYYSYQPSFNPKNDQEVAYLLLDKNYNRDTIKIHLVIANLSTLEHKFVSFVSINPALDYYYRYNNAISWFDNGLIYVDYDNFFINPTTLEKKAIEFSGFIFFNATVTNDATNLFVKVSNLTKPDYQNIIGNSKYALVNVANMEILPYNNLDNFDISSSTKFKLSHENRYLFKAINDNNIYLGSLGSVEHSLFYSGTFFNTSNDYFEDGVWLPNGKEFVFSNEDGLFLVNGTDNEVKRIKSNCWNRIYRNPTISATGERIIVEKREIVKRTIHDEEPLKRILNEINSSLVIMDIDGCNEKVLFEDWDGTVIGRP